jgi:signal transduction histidine kinase
MNLKLSSLKALSFQNRIIITFSLLTLLLVSVFTAISYFTVRTIYLEQLEHQIELFTRVISTNLDFRFLEYLNTEQENSFSKNYYEDLLIKQNNQMEFIQAFIFDKDFNLVVETNSGSENINLQAALLLNNREINQLLPGESVTSQPFKGNDGQWYLWGYHRINENYFLGIQESADRLARVDQLSRIFIGIGIFAILLTLFAGILLAHTLSSPINKLVKFSQALGSGAFDTPVPEKSLGEIGILINALDHMRQDLQRYHKEREEMLAQIAHEIKNPLGGIELLAGLVREDLQENKLDANYAIKIQQDIANLKAQINAYLNFSRPVMAKPELIEINKVIEEAQRALKKQFSEKQITLKLPDSNPTIRFDPNHLKQILTNLLSNSIEACAVGGSISIHFAQESDKWILSVCDDGRGISEENLTRIFEPFFTSSSGGTGLGLAVCRKLCRENNSEIRADNNPDKGCTFSIEKQNSSLV